MHSDARYLALVSAALLVSYRFLLPGRRRAFPFKPVLLGMAVGAILFPLVLGLVTAYRAALLDPPRLFWTSFADLARFHVAAPLADTLPRGAFLGLLAGLIVGLRRSTARGEAPDPGLPSPPREAAPDRNGPEQRRSERPGGSSRPEIGG